jgi:hypothetical protein
MNQGEKRLHLSFKDPFLYSLSSRMLTVLNYLEFLHETVMDINTLTQTKQGFTPSLKNREDHVYDKEVRNPVKL